MILKPGSLARLVMLFVAGMAITMVGQVKADLYLVGVQLYRTDGSGRNIADPYQFSTNSSTDHYGLSINGGAGFDVSSLLADGDNLFSFAPLPGQAADPGGFAGLNLFFSTTGIPFNPPAGSMVAGDLTVFSATDGLGSFAVTAAGASVLSYGTSGSIAVQVPANGFTSILLDGRKISISEFAVDGLPGGSFLIRVDAAAVPEPASLAMLALGGLTAGMMARRSRHAA